MPKHLWATGLRFLWIALLIIIVDRLSKYWMMQHLIFHQPIKILPILNLTLAYNKGAAFSFLDGASGWQNIFLGALAAFVSIIVLVWLKRTQASARWINTALCLILGGAIGNAWDRLLFGFVIDFISFHWREWYFAIFNVADSAICIGTFMLFVAWILMEKK